MPKRKRTYRSPPPATNACADRRLARGDRSRRAERQAAEEVTLLRREKTEELKGILCRIGYNPLSLSGQGGPILHVYRRRRSS